MSEVEPPPLALPIECYQIRTGTPAASDVTDRGVGVVRDGVLRATLIDQNHVNVVLADVPPLERLADWRIRHNQTAFVIFVDGADEDDSLDGERCQFIAIFLRCLWSAALVIPAGDGLVLI
jgi:hypothetical protein